ncbi:MAG: hypothetical protein R2713_21410 [Ilumatobacteraceae bacterium]
MSTIDDLDRQVEGAQVVAHVVTLHHDDGPFDAVEGATVTVVAGAGVVLDGLDRRDLRRRRRRRPRHRQLVDHRVAAVRDGSARPATDARCSGPEQLPASAELDDGAVLGSEISVDRAEHARGAGGPAGGVEGRPWWTRSSCAARPCRSPRPPVTACSTGSRSGRRCCGTPP